MAQTLGPLQPAAGEAEALELAEVERRLAAAIQATPDRTRASTLNLICCAENAADAQALAAELATLARRHPGRILLVSPAAAAARGAAPGEWRARILWASAGEGPICGEIVQLEAAGMALLSASMAVAPLLLGQVPVFLWWRGEDPIDNPRFEDLAAISDRILLDSQALAYEPEAFLRLAEEQRRLHHHGCVSDLTWTRLTRWRQMIAQAFDSSAAMRQLGCIEAVSFEATGGEPAVNSGSLLLAGWLASRLRWRPARRIGPAELELTAPGGGAVRMSFQAGARPAASGYLLSAVSLRSRDGLLATVARGGDKIKLALHSGDATLACLTTSFPTFTLTDALRSELDHLRPDPVAEQAMTASVELMYLLGTKRS